MVSSLLNKKVSYKEDSDIDSEDRGHKAEPYDFILFDKELVVVFGKPKYTKIQYGVVFFPIYLVVNETISAQIGVVEVPKNKVLSMIDEDSQLIVDKIDNPLLFSFVTEKYVDRYGSNVEPLELSKSDEEEEDDDKDPVEIIDLTSDDIQEVDVDIDSDEEDAIVKVKVPKNHRSKILEKTSTILDKGIFKVDSDQKVPLPLVEENETDAKQTRKDFKSGVRNAWIEKFMKNNHYSIHNVENNGDCFFAVVRDAFKQVGYHTTVEKLRAIVSKEATHTIFDEHRRLFLDLDGTLREYTHEMNEIKKNIEGDLKNRALDAKKTRKTLGSKETNELLARILEIVEEQKKRYVELKEAKKEIQTLIDENVSDLSKIDTLEKFRAHILTKEYWADSWAISILERELDMKMIILSERAYLDGDLDGVVMCGEIDAQLQKKGRFEPKYYIMTSFSGDHFKLVLYKHKRILEYHEIPYHMKGLIVNKCMEKGSGVFSIIPSFQDLQERMGIEKDEKEDEDEEDRGEFDNTTTLAFHSLSSKSALPGNGVQEQITKAAKPRYVNLSKHKNWRQMLDDSWTEHEFEVDGKKYASVEHYYQGAKFKKLNPDFALQFSLDNKSPLSRDIDLARSAGSITGKPSKNARKKLKQDVLLRPVETKIDPDFYRERAQQERLVGLTAKFTQNELLKTILKDTLDAKLVQFKRGSPGEADHVLMTVRRHLEK